MGDPLSVYIHWPFCASKCPYCDFNSRKIASDLDQEAWLAAYLAETTYYASRLAGREIHSIYFGGGTPSLMKPSVVAAILDKIAALWNVQQNCEITIEANPTSSEKDKFQAFKSAGVNRLSLGVQALNDADLQFLGRQHTNNAAREVIEFTSKTFDRYSFDLIYARAGQTVATWGAELQEALSFGAQHMSLYQLTIEEGTVFAKRSRHETLCVDEDCAADLFIATQELMSQAGRPAYEVSNHAVTGQESRHNLVYWRYEDYVGIGPGAHGRYFCLGQRIASENILHPQQWLLAASSGQGEGQSVCEVLDGQTSMKEALLMGLRLYEGINLARWGAKFGQDLTCFIDKTRLERLCKEGLMVKSGMHVAVTPNGMRKLNAVLDWLIA